MTPERRPGQPADGQQPFCGGTNAPRPAESQTIHGPPANKAGESLSKPATTPGNRRGGRSPGRGVTPEEHRAVVADQDGRREQQQQDFHERVLAYCHQLYPDPLTPEALEKLRQAFEAEHKTRSVDFDWLFERHARPSLELLEDALAGRLASASYDSFEDERLDVVHNYVAVLKSILLPPLSSHPEDPAP